MADIFISYSSHDRIQALSLVERLRQTGYDVWIDQHQLQGATRWGREIANAIDETKLFVVLVSSASLVSENVIKELNLAAQKHKHILPILTERLEFTGEFAYHLSGLQRCRIDNTDSILRAIQQLDLKSNLSSGSAYSPSENVALVSSSSKDIRLAVLPFDDLSKEGDNEWFADGMLDELISTLGALEHMKVPSRTDVMYYKKHHPKAQEIARDLNVRYLVGGGVRKSGNKIRITASMTDTYTNQQVWTQNYDGDFDDIFDLQENISRQITDALKITLTPEDKKIIAEKPTNNAEAYELYLRGSEFHKMATKSGYEKALELYQQAITIDESFVNAYLDLANTYATYYKECSRDLRWLICAETNLLKAETLSGETYRTLWIRGELEWQRGNFQIAESVLQRASLLNSRFEPIYNILGNLYLKNGKISAAIAAFQKVLFLKESHEHYFNYLTALSRVEDAFERRAVAQKALPLFKQYVSRNPNNYFWFVSYAYVLHWAELDSDALFEAEKLSMKTDLDGLTLFNLGALFDELGQPERNLALFRDAVSAGFRDIDAFKSYTFTFGSEDCLRALQDIIDDLHKIIVAEMSSD